MHSSTGWRAVAALALVAGMLAAFASPEPASAGGKTSSAAARPAAEDDGWPATPAGAMARDWVRAFSSGEPAVRTFYEKYLDRKKLAARPMSARLESYRKFRDRYGDLALAEVIEQTPGVLKAKLIAADASLHTFVFTVEKSPPHRFVSVTMLQHRHGPGHGSGSD
jgi:hypothetical protein